jgi:hypothetical protein
MVTFPSQSMLFPFIMATPYHRGMTGSSEFRDSCLNRNISTHVRVAPKGEDQFTIQGQTYESWLPTAESPGAHYRGHPQVAESHVESDAG